MQLYFNSIAPDWFNWFTRKPVFQGSYIEINHRKISIDLFPIIQFGLTSIIYVVMEDQLTIILKLLKSMKMFLYQISLCLMTIKKILLEGLLI
ncbi:MAG: hypothetical protein CM15mP93_09280 [Thiotrichaceae bacterium]|nr:MAG: hypothetical protein CM15mP93_09280 [Thiotrichaceae bacterium]